MSSGAISEIPSGGLFVKDYVTLPVSAMWTCGPKSGETWSYKIPGVLGMTSTYKDETPKIRGFVVVDIPYGSHFYTLQEAVSTIFNQGSGIFGTSYKYSVDDIMKIVEKLHVKLGRWLEATGVVPDVDATHIGFIDNPLHPSEIYAVLVPLWSKELTVKEMEADDVGWWPENQIRRFIEESRS